MESHANSLITYEGTYVYLAEEIKKWRERTKQNYVYSIQIGLTMDQGRRNYMEDRAEAKAWEPFPEILPGFKAAFVAVYDGHGGSVAVEIVKEKLRKIIMDEWRAALFGFFGLDSNTEHIGDERKLQPGPERDQVEKLSLTLIPGILRRAFAIMQDDLEKVYKDTGKSDGTTAVVNLLVYNKLFSAHCGDSRAVMIRGGVGLAITNDHKPNEPSERERIETLGGTVRKIGSVHRVNGNLSVSRTLGDCAHKVRLKEPGYTSLTRHSLMLVLNQRFRN